jgi:hypothetical protein
MTVEERLHLSPGLLALDLLADDARKTWDEWTDRVLAAEDSREVDVMMASSALWT